MLGESPFSRTKWRTNARARIIAADSLTQSSCCYALVNTQGPLSACW